MVAIIGRGGWNALPPNWIIPSIDYVDTFVVHHSVTAQPRDFDESVVIWQQIQRQHLGTRDHNGKLTYGDIAYNVGVGHQCVLVGRGVTLADGATDNDPATHTWSVCVLGDYRTDLLTDAFRFPLLAALQLGIQLYGRHPVRPHYDFYATACPGPNLAGQLPAIEEELMTTTDDYFKRPITLSDGEVPVPYPTDIEGWYIYTHRELQIIRQVLQKIEEKL